VNGVRFALGEPREAVALDQLISSSAQCVPGSDREWIQIRGPMPTQFRLSRAAFRRL
jgi:hypothetical protein